MFQRPNNVPQQGTNQPAPPAPNSKAPMPSRPEEFEGPAAEVEAKFQKLNPDEKKKILKGITPELGTLFLKIMPEELHPVFVLGMKSNPEQVRDDTPPPQQGRPQPQPNRRGIFSG